MSRLTDLLAQAKAKDSQLGVDLEREFKVLSARLPFGLNFERHSPEAVELPQRPVRKGDKVRVLAARGSPSKSDPRLWRVARINKASSQKSADLELLNAPEAESRTVPLENLVVVAEFRDTVYPGLASTGHVERGGEKPYHTVINGENYHVLKTLTYTHRGSVDVIYIDPPYNTGAKDWKYNNDFVDKEDIYRHSKWLAFMERRLVLARELLNPTCSVLIVTIDEKEYLRLGLLLEQLFPGRRMQMISTSINPSGVARGKEFYRVDEYIFFVYIGDAVVQPVKIPGLCITKSDLESEDDNSESDEEDSIAETEIPPDLPSDLPPPVRWESLLRSGTGARREDSQLKFYPVLVDAEAAKIIGTGAPLPLEQGPSDFEVPQGLTAIWPIRQDGSLGRWQLNRTAFETLEEAGHVKIGNINAKTGKITLLYLPTGLRHKLKIGEILVVGEDRYGGMELEFASSDSVSGRPKTQWATKAHSATDHGSSLLRKLIPGRKFPYPKSLYAVEDAIRFFVLNKPDAVILDFFAGSGTTAHAVMRLNRQDGGNRQCISVTNNEIGEKAEKQLRKKGVRPGDDAWEGIGICEYITKPRLTAAITGVRHDGQPVKGDYSFTDKFPISAGFQESAEFFQLTYETPVAVSHHAAFARIAPLLWLRAGSRGRRIDRLPGAAWAVVEAYGLLVDVDCAAPFCKAIAAAEGLRIAYIVTDDERRFQAITRRLPSAVEPVRLYESYLTNFSFAYGE